MNKVNNDNAKKRNTHSINKFRMKRNSNMKIFYPKLKKEDFHNSYLARTFKKHFIYEKEIGSLFCSQEFINGCFKIESFIIKGVKGEELFEDNDFLLKFDIQPIVTGRGPNKIPIHSYYPVDPSNQDLNKGDCRHGDVEVKIDSGESILLDLSIHKDKINKLEHENTLLKEQVKKLLDLLKNTRSEKEVSHELSEIESSTNNILLNMKTKRGGTKDYESFITSYNSQVDSKIFLKNKQEAMNHVGKCQVDESLINALDNKNVADNKIQQDLLTYSNVPTVSFRKKDK